MKRKRVTGARASGKTRKRRRPITTAPQATRGFYGSQARLRRQVEGILEHKALDTSAFNGACDLTGSITLINGIAAGSDFNQRIGRKITIKTVQIRGHLLHQTATASNTLARVLVVYDSQPNGTTPSSTDILTSGSSQSFMNLNNRDRFRVISDSTFSLGDRNITATQAVQGSPSTALINVYKRVDLPVIFDGVTGGIGDIQTGAIWVLCVGDQAANNAYNAAIACRVRYVDG